MPDQTHPDPEVQAAITRLNDALCSYERNTYFESVLIIRGQKGFVHRSVSGKPGIHENITDEQLMGIVE
jgi:CRISPR/Cas system-associated exonuclease Cas4 (RecB family)